MTVLSRFIARYYKLPPAETHDIAVERNLRIPMPDGTTHGADRYYPRGSARLPTVLFRTPYGRSGYGLMAYLMAERGFQSVVESCRGRDDSGGKFEPFRGEREDGLATIEWLKRQEWFDGRLGMAGPSYLGFVQWALARDAGPVLKAICTQFTSSEFRTVAYPGGTFNLFLWIGWMQVTFAFKGSWLPYLGSMLTSGRRAKRAVWHLPLEEADAIALGEVEGKEFWRDWLTRTEPEDPWWAAEDHSGGVAEVTAPNYLQSGWYDFMLPELLRDYAALQRAGRNPYLTIGPWSHSSNGAFGVGLTESILWLRAHLLGETGGLRQSPVRIFVMGVDEWRDLPAWPIEGAGRQAWYLQPDGELAAHPPADSSPSRFRYDPADPTPNLAGAINTPLGRGSGAKDNRELETRQDVLTFSSEAFQQDLEIIGEVKADLYVRSSLEHTDFFARLCDVQPDGRSLNICDGILRLEPGRPDAGPGGIKHVTIDLWPTAYRFQTGHRMRVQVSSGAFPRFPRNLGTGEPMATGTKMQVAEQAVFHDPEHPSAVLVQAVG